VDGTDIQGKFSMVKHLQLAKICESFPLECFDIYGKQLQSIALSNYELQLELCNTIPSS